MYGILSINLKNDYLVKLKLFFMKFKKYIARLKIIMICEDYDFQDSANLYFLYSFRYLIYFYIVFLQVKIHRDPHSVDTKY